MTKRLRVFRASLYPFFDFTPRKMIERPPVAGFQPRPPHLFSSPTPRNVAGKPRGRRYQNLKLPALPREVHLPVSTATPSIWKGPRRKVETYIHHMFLVAHVVSARKPRVSLWHGCTFEGYLGDVVPCRTRVPSLPSVFFLRVVWYLIGVSNGHVLCLAQ